jgi:hypothetical protein
MRKILVAICLSFILASPALAQTPPSPSPDACYCTCRPQQATIFVAPAGHPGLEPGTGTAPNFCTPPDGKIPLGDKESPADCEAACKGKDDLGKELCSVMDSCRPLCKKDEDCEKGMICSDGICSGAAADSSSSSPTVSEPVFKPIAPRLSINIPTLSFPEFMDVKREGGYYYIPFIAVYMSALFRLAIGAAGVLAVIMIMIGGFVWIAAAGDSGKIGAAKKMIAGAATGLLLSLGSFTFLQIVNPDIVNLQAMKVKIVQPEELDIADDQESDKIDLEAFPAGPVTKPNWTAETYICPPNAALQPPAGVVDPSTLVKLDCPVGVVLSSSDSGGGRATQAVRNALCAAGEAADRQGYFIKVASSYRPFATQASLWCGRGATKYPDESTRRKYFAVPGFSNHGLGNAVDVVLKSKSTGKDLYPLSSSGQCSADPANVAKIMEIMNAGGFVRYEAEIWHFELNSKMPNRGAYSGLPAKCGK